jgi:tRNA dimethylallyltransferase
MATRLPLIVIVGPTASGKTSLSIRLAKEFGGEIISADSRAIYRLLDIGTAKPSFPEREGVPHWGIDLVNPDERFTVSEFKLYTTEKIEEIRRRGNVPFLVGGTGLYVNATIYDYQFPPGGNDIARRETLMKKGLGELYDYCKKHNIKLPENKKNKRYVVNNILRNGENPKRKHELLEDTIVVGIATEKSRLKQRIQMRAKQMFSPELYDEAVCAGKIYGWNSEAMTGNIYPLIRQIVAGEMTETEAMERFAVLDWQLAKRQLTWFRRDSNIRWLSLDDAYTYLAHHLSELNNSC